MKKEMFYRQFLILFFVFPVFLPKADVFGAAARRPRSHEQMGGAVQTEDPRRQALLQQAQEASGLLEKALDDFFTQINEYQNPGEIYVKSASVLLEDSRRHMMMFEDPAKARYMLLQGWVEYCTGAVESALTSSARACRTDAANRDAWISQQFFSLLLSKRPIQPRPPRPTMQRNPMGAGTPGGEMVPEPAAGQSLYGTTGKLDFNPESLRNDLIGKTLKPFYGAFLDGKPFQYQQPSEAVLCLFVWEVPAENLVEKKPEETNQPLLYTPARQTPAAGAGEETAVSPDGQTRSTFAAQLEAIEILKEQTVKAGKKDILFLSVITNKPDQKPAVQRYLNENPHPLPILYAAANTPDLVMDAKTPFTAIVDKNGQFRFAGSAEGFMLPMLLQNLTGFAFTKPVQQTPAASGEEFGPGIRPADPNRPVPVPADPNSRTAEAPAAVRGPTENDEYNEVCGANELAAAQDFFLQAAGKRFISYRKGVDLCRQIIRNCPNSKNAEAARELLRTKIPEDQRESLGLTKEELGL
ncbi:MAG TPA: hypothetical protein PKY88_01975 [Anaerohalosphaeraceae bacterium]|nr:hypothetical protein [Anaerohalosphaeraceae bacterium]